MVAVAWTPQALNLIKAKPPLKAVHLLRVVTIGLGTILGFLVVQRVSL